MESNSFSENVRIIKSRQNFSEFYSRHFSGKISPYLAAACVNTPITPNHLTLAMIPAGVIGALLCSTGTLWGFFFGGLFLISLNILDASDGELARFTNTTSLFGDYLDRVAHYITNSAAMIGVGIGLYFYTGMGVLLLVMLVLEISVLFDEVARDLLLACGIDKKESETDTRKQRKVETRLSAPKWLHLIWRVTFSGMGFFHLVPIIAIVSMFLPNLGLFVAYYLLFTLVALVKAGARARLILRIYTNDK